MTGRPGGRLVFATRTEPKTLNPVTAVDAASREVIQRMDADLIHINRVSFRTEPALAMSWTVSSDGLRYVLELRHGLRFSDGHPGDADDVVFTFQVHLDEKIHSGQRDLLTLDGKPIVVRKLDAYRVAFELPAPDAVAERLFDGIAILPRHLLEKPYREGKLAEAWGLRTPPAAIAGLGPFRLKEYVAGQRVVLERNPYYWKADAAGNRLPYLAEVDFVIAGTDDLQVLRFQSGESDVISRPSAKNYSALEKDRERRGYVLQNAGAGFEYNFLFFNLNDLPANTVPQIALHQSWFRRRAFRQAVSAAIDREALVRLIYLGYATPLSGPVPPGNRLWIDADLPQLVRQPARAKELLAADGFKWSPEGVLMDAEGRNVEFSILASAGNPERVQAATLIQDDLQQVGMRVEVAPLETRSLLDRVQRTHEYDACILSMASTDADPNVEMNVWLSSGGSHLWHPEQSSPATAWEAEIDRLMRRQIVTRQYADRKRMYDRVQEILMENLPLVPLVSPNVLAGAKKDLGNFRPALLDHYTLWNIEELYWRVSGAGARR
ncbi:MAG: ABC transporter substrate-binding protein [Acidobacteriia bacterium]|nr:ABC transporter substrate-binding protein [Terriglobia bacterium]